MACIWNETGNVPVSRHQFKENLLFHLEGKVAAFIEFTRKKSLQPAASSAVFCRGSCRAQPNPNFQLFSFLLTCSAQTRKSTRCDSASGSKQARTWRKGRLLNVCVSVSAAGNDAIYTWCSESEFPLCRAAGQSHYHWLPTGNSAPSVGKVTSGFEDLFQCSRLLSFLLQPRM